MACRIRVATVNARLSLPEITFGILPGAKDVREIGRANCVVPSNRLITEEKRLPTSLQKKD
jgi:enoyl-CoA hydratase/carnithine racemase